MRFDSTYLPPELPWELLDRYLTNNVSDEERAEVDAYLRTQPEISGKVRAFAAGITSDDITDSNALPDHIWDNIQMAIRPTDRDAWQGIEKSQLSHPTSFRRSSIRSRSPRTQSRIWMTLATLCIVVFGGYGIFRIPAVQSGVFAADDRPDVRRLSTGKGQRASIELSDGTKVTLNVSSTITLPPDFGKRDRVIHLDGEAFFEVPESAGKPFIVNTATSTTRVLGTQFTVRDYREEQIAVTKVIQGKVDVGGTVLTAYQQSIRTRDGRINVSSIDNSIAGDWVNGHIAFNRTALQDVITELNRWYDVEFVLDDTSLATELVTLRVHNRSASEVATILTDIFGIRYRKDGSRIVFVR